MVGLLSQIAPELPVAKTGMAFDVAIHLLHGGQVAWATAPWTFESRWDDQTISALRCAWICGQSKEG